MVALCLWHVSGQHEIARDLTMVHQAIHIVARDGHEDAIVKRLDNGDFVDSVNVWNLGAMLASCKEVSIHAALPCKLH